MKYTPLIFTVLLLASILGLQYAFAQPEAQDISVSPDSISISLIKSPWGDLKVNRPSVTLNVHTLGTNVTVIDIYADTFFEEKDRWPPISSKLLVFTTVEKELDGLRRSEIEVSFDLPSDMHPSAYKGNIHVTSSSGSRLTVPVNLKVSESEWVIGAWTLIGVFLNLFLFMIKDVIDERNKLRETLNLTEAKITAAYSSICNAIRETRFENLKSASKYILAHTEFTQLIGEWNDAVQKNAQIGAFTQIGRKGDRVIEFANGSGKIAEEVEIVDTQFLDPPKAYDERSSPEDRLRYNKALDYFWRSRTLEYLALLITFSVVVMNSWQTYLKEAVVFGASGFADYFAALLFGFGSQTVLTQGVGLAKSWAESRLAE